jgi:hypothetical protein
VTTDTESTNHFADALGRALRYAVLTKSGRIQILVKPTTKELRRRGRRGWQLFGTVEGDDGALATLLEVVQQAVSGMEAATDTAGHDGKKPKGAKAAGGTVARKGKKSRGAKAAGGTVARKGKKSRGAKAAKG